MPKNITSKLTLLILIAFACFGAYSLIASKFAFKRPPMGKTKVTVVAVRQDITFDKVEALGTAFANESADISANISENVVEILFFDNQQVVKDMPLVVLAQDEEIANRNRAMLQLHEQQREFTRLKNLLAKNAASQKEFDAGQTLLAIAKQDVSEINARITDRTITAPFDGVIGLRNVSIGSLVTPGDIITTIDDVSKIKVDFTIPSVYMENITTDTPIIITSEVFQGKQFNGKIAFIDSRVDPLTRSIKMRAIVGNDNAQLKPGLLMYVTILKDQRDALVIPQEAITQLKRQYFVWVVDRNNSNKVMRREITIGARFPDKVEVISGLKEGDLVITRGITIVREGQEVDYKISVN
jgi:membrane fusion protein (multidrug efflux system)